MRGRDTAPRAVSVSLGSSTRDFSARVRLGAREVYLERRGTDGDLAAAATLIRELDGVADAIGLGGINFDFCLGALRYPMAGGRALAGAAVRTPIGDGGAWKEGVEGGKVVPQLEKGAGFDFHGATVLMVSMLDRYPLGRALMAAGARLLIGDAMFALKVPVLFQSLASFTAAARVTMPALRRFPVAWLYPLGKGQEITVGGSRLFRRAYEQADYIVGDFHLIRRHLPPRLAGKVMITSTVTQEDVAMLSRRGLKTLIATSPSFGGRSPGANLMEAALTAVAGRRDGITAGECGRLYEELGLQPRIEHF